MAEWRDNTYKGPGGGYVAINDTVSGGTAGDLLWVGTGPILSQSSYLTWDPVNSTLIVQSQTPGADGFRVLLYANTGQPTVEQWPLGIFGDTDQIVAAMINAYGTGSGYFPAVVLQRADGTPASPSAIQVTDIIGMISSHGYGTSGYFPTAQVVFRAAETWTNTHLGSQVEIVTVANTTNTTRVVATFGNDGTLQMLGGLGAGMAPYGGNGVTSKSATSGTGGNFPLLAYNSTPTIEFYVNDAGIGFLNAAAWTYSSDERLKENIAPLGVGLAEILRLQPRQFDYIDGAKDALGFVAQELREVVPQAVIEHQPPGFDTPMLGSMTEYLIPILVKAMQEEDAEFEALKARVAALEGANA